MSRAHSTLWAVPSIPIPLDPLLAPSLRQQPAGSHLKLLWICHGLRGAKLELAGIVRAAVLQLKCKVLEPKGVVLHSLVN